MSISNQENKDSDTKKQSKLSILGNKLWNSTKKGINKLEQRMTMQGLLKQACLSFEYYLNPKIIKMEDRISKKTLIGAKGIAFISEAKGGLFFGVKGGSGIILIKTSNNKWSAPCAVGIGGISFGFQGGISKVDHIIILSNDEQVKIFMGKGQLQLKTNAEASLLKYGRQGNVGVNVGNKQIKPVYSYSFGVKGIYGGISLDGDILVVRNKCNKKFYGDKYDIKNILDGNVPMPNDNEYYNKIITYLKDYCNIKDDIGYDGDKDIEQNSRPNSNDNSLSDMVLNTLPLENDIKGDIHMDNNHTNMNNETDIKDTNINQNDNDTNINEANNMETINMDNHNDNTSPKLSLVEQHKMNMKLQREMELQNQMFFDDDTDAFGFANNL